MRSAPSRFRSSAGLHAAAGICCNIYLNSVPPLLSPEAFPRCLDDSTQACSYKKELV